MKSDMYFEFKAIGSENPMPTQFQTAENAIRWMTSYKEKHPEQAKKLELFQVTVTVTKEKISV